MSGNAEVEALLELINTATHDALSQYDKNVQDIPSLQSTDQRSLSTMSGNLPLKRAIRLLEGACGQLCATLAPPAHTVINRVQSYDAPCMRVAREMRVADALLDHPKGLHVSELAKVVNVEQGKLAHILRLLGTKHCFREVDTDVFANNRLSLVLLSSSSVSDLVSLHTTEMARGGSLFLETLSDKEYAFSYDPTKAPYMYAVRNEGIQGTYFDWMIAHNFGRAMIGVDQVMNFHTVLEHFPWMEAMTVCDVGSGVGAFSLPLVQMYPHVKVTLHDLPETLSQAKDIWSINNPEAIQDGRVDFAPLNFFEQVPATGQDVYYLRNIMHNWPDEQAKIILQKIQQAMQPHSRVLIREDLIDGGAYQHLNRTEGNPDNVLGVEIAPEPLLPNFGAGNARMYNQDLGMMVSLNAKERTLDESMKLAHAAGLRLEKVWDFAEASLLELRLA
ncbi:S-adenosyl-L-methionine-dependent methyltransferase [Amylocystis lapponica]|nr:S-adenosyl-L-methionine-dependent methyltransferase [Amylocystis lapponica]